MAAAAISLLGSLIGGRVQNNTLSNARGDLQNILQTDPQNFSSFFGNLTSGQGGSSFQQSPGQQALFEQLQGQSGNFLGGGLFNNQNFQQAFGANDIFGAQQGLQGLLGQQFQGPGGLQGQAGGLFGQAQGFFNQAQDQSGLIQQNLDASRALAQPQEDLIRNQFFNNEFSSTRGATAGSQNRQQLAANAATTRDAQRVLGAQGLGLQQQGQLFQQGLGAFQQGLGAQGQQFGQALGTQQQNIGQGQQGFQNALGLFGLGQQTQLGSFGAGLQGLGVGQNQQDLLQQLFLGQQNADANRIGAQGQFANALGNVAVNQASNQGNFFSNLFSDERLKENIQKIGEIGDVGWYEWDWNEKAEKMGISGQPNFGVLAQEVAKRYPDAVHMTATGFMQVNYRELQRML